MEIRKAAADWKTHERFRRGSVDCGKTLEASISSFGRSIKRKIVMAVEALKFLNTKATDLKMP